MAEVAALELVIRTKRAQTAARQTERRIKAVGTQAVKTEKRVKRSTVKMGAAFTKLKGSIFSVQGALATLGLGLGLGAVVKTLTEFEFAMSRVRAITGATGMEFKALQNTARELGGTTVFTATQAAEGMRLLAMAGFDTNEAIEAIPGTLNLAVAGAVDLATAADITASALRGFNLDASEAGRVADVLAATSTSANTTIQELGDAVKFVAPVAAATGQSIEEMAAAIGTLSDAGLKGTLAGTGLRRVLVGLVNVTPKGEKALEGMGLTLEQINPEMNKLTDIISLFNEKSLGTAEAFELFGLRGGPAILVLTQMAGRLEELTGTTEEAAGSAQKMADIMRDNLRGDALLLKSVIQEVVLQQSAFRDSLRELVQEATLVTQALGGNLPVLTENAEKYEELAQKIRNAGEVAKDFAKVLGLVVGPATKSISAISDVTDSVRELVDAYSEGRGRLEAESNLFVDALSLGVLGPVARVFKDDTDLMVEQLVRLRGEITETRGLVEDFGALRGLDLIKGLPLAEQQAAALTDQMQRVALEIGKLKEERAALVADEGAVDRAFDFIGVSPGITTVSEEISALDAKIFAMTAGLEDAGIELAKIGATAQGARDVKDGLAAIAEETEKIIKAGTDVESTLKRALASAANSAEKTLGKLEFKIEQARLGGGAEADLQRDINEAFEAADVRVLVTPEIKDVQTELRKQISDIEDQLQRVTDESTRKVLVAQLEAGKRGLRDLDDMIVKRGQLREQIENEATALFRLTEEQERQEELIERATKLKEDAASPQQKLLDLQTELNELVEEGLLKQQKAAEIFAKAQAETPQAKAIEGLRKQLAQLGIVTDRDRIAMQALTAAQKDNSIVSDDQRMEIEGLADEIERMGRVNTIAKDAIANARTPADEYAQSLGDLGMALETGLIDARQYESQLGHLRLEQKRGQEAARGHQLEIMKLDLAPWQRGLVDLREQVGFTEDAFSNIATGAVQEFSSALVQAFKTGEFNGDIFLGILAKIGDQLIELATQEFLIKPLLSGLTGTQQPQQAGGGGLMGILGTVLKLGTAVAGAGGGGGGGFAGGGNLDFSAGGNLLSTAGAFAEGGISHRPTSTTLVSSAMMAQAKRFQFGGTTGDTIPAMLSRNEGVVPLRGGRSIPVELEGDDQRGQTNVVNFNITTPDAESFQRSQGQISASVGAVMRRHQSRNN